MHRVGSVQKKDCIGTLPPYNKLPQAMIMTHTHAQLMAIDWHVVINNGINLQ